MSKFYSPSKRGFYAREVHGTSMPKDVIEIDDAEWQRLISEQGKDGKVIRPGPDGRPCLTKPQ